LIKNGILTPIAHLSPWFDSKIRTLGEILLLTNAYGFLELFKKFWLIFYVMMQITDSGSKFLRHNDSIGHKSVREVLDFPPYFPFKNHEIMQRREHSISQFGLSMQLYDVKMNKSAAAQF
jgi:hypothetical protein